MDESNIMFYDTGLGYHVIGSKNLQWHHLGETMKVTVQMNKGLWDKIVKLAEQYDRIPDSESEDYAEWYENRSYGTGNFDDTYQNGWDDGLKELASEILEDSVVL